MTFAENYREAWYPEWKFYYVDYEKLRDMINKKTIGEKKFEEADEAHFIEELESEMQKVNTEYNK